MFETLPHSDLYGSFYCSLNLDVIAVPTPQQVLSIRALWPCTPAAGSPSIDHLVQRKAQPICLQPTFAVSTIPTTRSIPSVGESHPGGVSAANISESVWIELGWPGAVASDVGLNRLLATFFTCRFARGFGTVTYLRDSCEDEDSGGKSKLHDCVRVFSRSVMRVAIE
jgi:hypothetical protein